MGGRLLRSYILKPLLRPESILSRQDKVQFLINDSTFYHELLEVLKHIYDFERLLSKLSLNRITPKELLSLKNSLLAVLQLATLVEGPNPLEPFAATSSVQKTINQIDNTLLTEPHNDINEGDVIQNGVDATLDRLRKANEEGVQWIMDLLEKEKRQTGIANLKIKYTDNSGYFFEVTKSQLGNVPDYFIKKQTMINGSRYTTETLLQYQEDILSAKEKAIELEVELYLRLKEDLTKEVPHLQAASFFCAQIDVLGSFATTALRYQYCRPQINEPPPAKEGEIGKTPFIIQGGRHAVMEQLDNLEFIPNDLQFKSGDHVHIITGPNMGGKSTYLRQNALIVLLSQMGSFVPADRVEITTCDRIFTRIGASDNLIKGESTFLSEMSETGYILSQATSNSLIIMDEIGRGTSTYDGLSLAWAIIEFICHPRGPRAKTLFATHYHELTALESHPGISNYHVSVSEEQKKLLFTKKVSPGAADKSYGIHVAELAGLPPEVIRRAEKKLEELEKVKPSPSRVEMSGGQMSMLEKPPTLELEAELTEAIKAFDADNSTPMDSLLLLQKLQKLVLEKP